MACSGSMVVEHLPLYHMVECLGQATTACTRGRKCAANKKGYWNFSECLMYMACSGSMVVEHLPLYRMVECLGQATTACNKEGVIGKKMIKTLLELRKYFMACSSSIVVEHSALYPMVKGWSTAPSVHQREKMDSR